jgi:integrase/recombinase XerD
MARHRHPFTVGLPLEDWPEGDRQAWEIANQDGDLLTGRGPAAHWKPKTRLTARKAYGNWLRFLKDRNLLGSVPSIGFRLKEENLRDYIASLRARASPNTVLTQLRHLSSAIAAMDPTTDRRLLKLALSRLTPGARPVRDKRGRLVSPLVLLGLGQKLMAEWQARPVHDPRLNAMDYRDGLMIAHLALCPIRLENLAAVVIGRHLTFDSGRPRLAFTADEMKGKRPLEFDMPAVLQARLAFYLSDIHPMLYRGPQLGAPLWPSLHTGKPQMSEHGIYTRMTQVTEKHLGHPVTPHMFRDAAATFITELAPEHAMMAAAVLQHANLDVTMRHYVHGQQHLAALKYHAAIDEMIARVAAEPVDL